MAQNQSEKFKLHKHHIAYKYRIYPNEQQAELFAKTFGCVRFVYNQILEYKKNLYETEHKNATWIDCSFYCRHTLKAKYEWLKEVDKFALDNAIINVNSAFQGLFRGDKKYPKFKSKKRSRRSYTTNRENITIENGLIKLPKVGLVKIKQHRPIPNSHKIKSVTISQSGSGKYYASVLCEYELEIQNNEPKEFIGLDFSMHELYKDSNGNEPNFPHYLRNAEARLKREQRKLSNMKVGSNNREKQRIKVAKLYEKVANQRKDFLHKQSRQIANSYDCVCIEDLNMQQMARALRFGKSVSDNGWGLFTKNLSYKLGLQGKSLVKVDRFFPSSQTCSVCGCLNKATKDLKIRAWICPECGAVHDRDFNAAINIRNEGMRLIGA